MPLFTDFALSLGSIVSGSVIVEMIFSYPGIGSVLFTAVQSLDYPVIQGKTFIIILAATTTALLLDLAYPFIDPRVGEK
jgi:peptide/nickel transport system permease protein